MSYQLEAEEVPPRDQVQSGSTAQVELHPSPSLLLPSSQYPDCGAMTFPSPHSSDHTLAVDESPVVHSQPDSI